MEKESYSPGKRRFACSVLLAVGGLFYGAQGVEQAIEGNWGDATSLINIAIIGETGAALTYLGGVKSEREKNREFIKENMANQQLMVENIQALVTERKETTELSQQETQAREFQA